MRRRLTVWFTALVIFAAASAKAQVTEQWVARYNGLGTRSDIAHAVAVNNNGIVYVTGESLGAGTQRDYATVAYDTVTGQQLWVARYNGCDPQKSHRGEKGCFWSSRLGWARSGLEQVFTQRHGRTILGHDPVRVSSGRSSSPLRCERPSAAGVAPVAVAGPARGGESVSPEAIGTVRRTAREAASG